MDPIVVKCERAVPLSPERIRERFLEVESWSEFRGYGPIPGIAEARFLERTPEGTGSRIAVTNTDGSHHVEEITACSDAGLELRLGEFSPPLSHLATHFVETLTFSQSPEPGSTQVTRSMELHPKGCGRPFLWLISRFVGQALARHLAEL